MSATNLPPAQSLALNYAFGRMKQLLAAFLQFDWRLAQFVGQAKEPIATQLRLAWWREELAKPAGARATGDADLDRLSALWEGEETALISLVDGWEALLEEPPLSDQSVEDFVSGRANCFAALACMNGLENAAATARKCGYRWALADLVSRISDADERALVLERAAALSAPRPFLPRPLRPLMMLDTLAGRALARGGGPLVAGRGDVLTVMRLGLFGR